MGKNELNKNISQIFNMSEKQKRRIASILVATSIMSGAASLTACSTHTSNNTTSIITEDEAYTFDSVLSYFNLFGLLNNINVENIANNKTVTKDEAKKLLENIMANVDEDLIYDDIFLIYDGIIDTEEKESETSTITVKDFIKLLYRFISNTHYVVTTKNTTFSRFKSINWAISNGIVTEDIIAKDGAMTYEECIDILNKFVLEYDLLNDHRNLSSKSIDFINAIDSNEKLPKTVKAKLKAFTKLIENHEFDKATLDRINNIFANMNYSKETESELTAAEFDFPENYSVEGAYNLKYNTMRVKTFNKGVILFVGSLALGLDEKSGIDGLQDARIEKEYEFKRGITMGVARLITNELTNALPDDAFYSNTMTATKLLAEAIDAEDLLNFYVSADLDGFVEYLTDIYEKDENNRQIAANRVTSLMKCFDKISEYDLGTAKKDDIVIKYIISEINELSILFKGEGFENNKDAQALINTLLGKSNEGIDYDYSKYYFNTEESNKSGYSQSKSLTFKK